MSDMRTGRGHMTGMAKSPSPGEDSKQAPDAEAGASRSGRRPSKDVSGPPPDGKSISHRLVEAVPAVARPAAAQSLAGGYKRIGGEFINGVSGAGTEMRNADGLPDGRLAQVVEAYLSPETTPWKPTVTAFAANAMGADVTQRTVREAFFGAARGLEGRAYSTPDLLESRFAFVVQELLAHGASMEVICAAVIGWHDGLVAQRPNNDRKATEALRQALGKGLDAAIRAHARDTARLPAIRQTVADMLGPGALVEDMVKLLQARKPSPDLEFSIVDRLCAAFKAPRGAASDVAWLARVLESIGTALPRLDDEALRPRGQGTMLVLQALFKIMPALTGDTAYVSALASALAAGLPADPVMLAWMRAHAATMPQAERLHRAITVLCQHDKLKLSAAALCAALEGLSKGLAPIDDKSAAMKTPIRPDLRRLIDAALPPVSAAYAPARTALLKALEDARLAGE